MPCSASTTATAAAAAGRSRLDEVLCILEVLASMTLAPTVADAALPPSESLTQVSGAGVVAWLESGCGMVAAASAAAVLCMQ